MYNFKTKEKHIFGDWKILHMYGNYATNMTLLMHNPYEIQKQVQCCSARDWE